ncbi:MAG TPA: hypothetical protein VH481_01705 [Nitrososphaeraceae archaeon]|jgi:predicted RNA-binding protein with EMAP domain
MITLTIASLGTFSGRLYAMEQLTKIAGSIEDQCNRIFNCKIKTESVVKYPNMVSLFDKSEEIGKTMTNNVNDAKKIQEQSCQKLMQVDVEQTKDQKVSEQLPKYLICLP